jgi:hypothetical protein
MNTDYQQARLARDPRFDGTFFVDQFALRMPRLKKMWSTFSLRNKRC